VKEHLFFFVISKKTFFGIFWKSALFSKKCFIG